MASDTRRGSRREPRRAGAGSGLLPAAGAAPRPPLGRFGHRELPGQAKADMATAPLADGVLTVPKAEAGKPRRIQVTAGRPGPDRAPARAGLGRRRPLPRQGGGPFPCL